MFLSFNDGQPGGGECSGLCIIDGYDGISHPAGCNKAN